MKVFIKDNLTNNLIVLVDEDNIKFLHAVLRSSVRLGFCLIKTLPDNLTLDNILKYEFIPNSNTLSFHDRNENLQPVQVWVDKLFTHHNKFKAKHTTLQESSYNKSDLIELEYQRLLEYNILLKETPW